MAITQTSKDKAKGRRFLGCFFVVFMLFGLGMDNQLYGARFKSDGNLLFGFFLVAPGQFKSLVADTIGTPGAGSFPELFGVGLDNQVYAARLGAQGTLINGFFLVAPGQFQSITAGQFGAGNPELIGIGQDKQLYAARFDPAGNFLYVARNEKAGQVGWRNLKIPAVDAISKTMEDAWRKSCGDMTLRDLIEETK